MELGVRIIADSDLKDAPGGALEANFGCNWSNFGFFSGNYLMYLKDFEKSVGEASVTQAENVEWRTMGGIFFNGFYGEDELSLARVGAFAAYTRKWSNIADGDKWAPDSSWEAAFFISTPALVDLESDKSKKKTSWALKLGAIKPINEINGDDDYKFALTFVPNFGIAMAE